MSNTDIYLNRLVISKFRGVSADIDLTFKNLDKKTSSCLIVGDNGSGKSSIIDAIELITLGTINRSHSLNIKSVPEVISQFSEKNPFLILELTNNDLLKKQIIFDCEGKKECQIISGQSGKYFFNPFILRRSDILLFWNTPDVQRQKIFWGFASGRPQVGKKIDSFDLVNIKNLKEKILEIKRERNLIRDKISESFDIPIQEIPFDIPEIYVFLKKNVYKGVKKGMVQILKSKGAISVDEGKEKICLRYLELQENLKQMSAELTQFNKGDHESIIVQKENIKRNLLELSPRITKNFIKLSNTAKFVEKIELILSDLSEISISFKVTLKNGNVVIPEQIFSESNLDLLAFIIFIELIRKSSDKGQLKVLILDDVFQSVDSSIRLKIIDFLLTDFEKWQFIITVHDRLWKEQLVQLFRNRNLPMNIFEILAWDPNQGPIIITESLLLEDTVLGSLDKGSVIEISSNASILLEKICNNLSYRLPISVTRKNQDKYTIGDLWPGISKELKKSTISTEIETLDQMIYLRNIIGSHFNEWAMSLSRDEAIEYANSVLNLLPKVKCKSCNRWIEDIKIGEKSQKKWSCRCGSIIIEKKMI
jgi:energy-coupling factor transporter ATP-binding protein EcfA2